MASKDSKKHDCLVCCNKFTSLKLIICPKCSYMSCVECIRKYLLLQIIDPHCMNCKIGWNIDFYENKLTKKFLNGEYKEHKKEILLAQELSLIPKTIEKINAEKEKNDRIKELQETINTLQIELTRLKSSSTESSIKFERPCPIRNCRGFLSTKWKCGVCNTNICALCREVKSNDKEHICDKNTLENIKVLEKDSRECPKCKMMIYKTDGCDAMFCTYCNTPWNWKTGKILDTKHLHNPHYFAWLNKVNKGENNEEKERTENRCAPDIELIRFVCNKTKDDIYFHYYRTIREISDRYIRNYERSDNEDLRKKYINNKLDKKDFKRLIYNRNKVYKKNIDFREIYEVYVNASNDILTKCITQITRNYSPRKNEYILQMLREETYKLIDFINNRLILLYKRYKTTNQNLLVFKNDIITFENKTKKKTRQSKHTQEEEIIDVDDIESE